MALSSVGPVCARTPGNSSLFGRKDLCDSFTCKYRRLASVMCRWRGPPSSRVIGMASPPIRLADDAEPLGECRL